MRSQEENSGTTGVVHTRTNGGELELVDVEAEGESWIVSDTTARDFEVGQR
jgi:hypothetical protein